MLFAYEWPHCAMSGRSIVGDEPTLSSLAVKESWARLGNCLQLCSELHDAVTFCSPLNFVNLQPCERTHIHGGDMVSKEYLETARTLLRAAQSTADPKIAGQPE
jgi:hypothetical protein